MILDPESACAQAVEGGLVVRKPHPLNCEIAMADLGGAITPNAGFYVRNHFPVPDLDPSAYRLEVRGLVQRPLSLSLGDVQALPARTHAVTLECAGNGRTRFQPAVPGEPWELGAVGTAEWTGAPLGEVLEQAGVRAEAREVLFRGADGGELEGMPGITRFERSLTVDQARAAEPLLVYAMNGEPLPKLHGAPLRLIVPGWYAVASVKWLTEIELIDKPFVGHYQTNKYWYEWSRQGETVREPITLMQVRALITEPAPDQEIPAGDLRVRGVAWSGTAPIRQIEVSAGAAWEKAKLVGESRRHGWQEWELVMPRPKSREVTLRARATDLEGRTQPDRAEWNRLGYGNNSIHEVVVRIF